MNLPQHGRVVVIDDEFKEEGLPLLEALGRKGISSNYYTGQMDKLPDEPFQDVRLVFVDIDIGYQSSDKNRISTIGNILREIISHDNGPYILIGWTKHSDLLVKIKDIPNLRPPMITLNLEKLDCRDDEGNYDITKIESKLKLELKKTGVFHLFMLWEDTVHQAAAQIVKDFSSFYDDENWNRNLANVVKGLAEAYAGKQLINKKEEILKNGLLTFNKTFLDSLESKIRDEDYSRIDIDEDFSREVELDDQVRAKINTKLLLIESPQSDFVQPGNIYLLREMDKYGLNAADLFNGQLDGYAERDELKELLKPVLLEVSPSCDFAQKKWKLNRLLPGFMWPSQHFSRKGKRNREIDLIKKADYIYSSPVFEKEELTFKLVFDFRLLTSTKELKEKPYFKIRHELLVDIQSCLARHMNRPGVISLD